MSCLPTRRSSLSGVARRRRSSSRASAPEDDSPHGLDQARGASSPPWLLAVMTEIQPRSGEIRLRAAGKTEWRPLTPLQPLRPGDVVRVAGDGRLVVALMDGQASQTITQSNSPFTVTDSVNPGDKRTETLVTVITSFLVKQHRDRDFLARIAVGGLRRP